MKNNYLKQIIVAVALTTQIIWSQTITHRYDFNGNTNDSIGSINAVATGASTFLEAPTFAATTPSGTVSGAPSGSLQLGASYGSKKSGFTIDGSAVASPFGSVSMWINPNSINADGVYLMRGLGANSDDGFNLNLGNNNSVLFWTGAYNTPTFSLVQSSSNVLNLSAWNNLVVTWDKVTNVGSLYVNGSQISGSFDVSRLNPSSLQVGGYNLNDNNSVLDYQYNGKMYDLQVYSSALSATDVSNIYSNPGTTLAIPEPSTYMILILGTFAVIGFARRKNKLIQRS